MVQVVDLVYDRSGPEIGRAGIGQRCRDRRGRRERQDGGNTGADANQRIDDFVPDRDVARFDDLKRDLAIVSRLHLQALGDDELAVLAKLAVVVLEISEVVELLAGRVDIASVAVTVAHSKTRDLLRPDLVVDVEDWHV